MNLSKSDKIFLLLEWIDNQGCKIVIKTKAQFQNASPNSEHSEAVQAKIIETPV